MTRLEPEATYNPPADFSQIVGHRTALDAIERAFSAGRGHHAYLFSGPDGVGKRTVAELLGQSLLCEEGQIGEPCNSCGPCRRVMAGSHADWIVLRPEGEWVKIGTIRDLIHQFSFRPFEAGARVVLLDDAERLTTEAANALLKLLEEPPPSSYFLLITANQVQLLPTIISRCQTIPFSPLSNDEVTKVIHRMVHDPETAVAYQLQLAERFCWGSPGRAWALLEDPVFQRRLDLNEDFFQLVRSTNPTPLALGDWADTADKRPSDGRSRLAQQRDITRNVLDLLRILIRDLMLLNAGGSIDLVINRDFKDQLSDVARELTSTRLSAILTAVREAEDAVDGNVGPRLVLENLATRVIDSGH